MLQLPIQSHQYNYLLQGYKEYLQTLGYALVTVQSWPLHVRELLHYLENNGVRHIKAVNGAHINDFTKYIQQRSNKARSGALSSSSVNKIVNAVNVFIRYVNSTGQFVTAATARQVENEIGERSILTVDEVKQLYGATFLPHRQNPVAMGQRDRAIIAVFYGCGLRRSEGRQLDVTDIDVVRRLLFVKKGKGNKQRYVPIAAKHLQDIKDYLQEGREWFLHQNNTTETWHSGRHGQPLPRKAGADDAAFFISTGGGRMQEFYQRLERMKERAELAKPLTLHGLRHSIATHLLQGGMSMEDIAKFLGHGSLESTQVYTHILNTSDGIF
jgi:integrase/recombinase XerD